MYRSSLFFGIRNLDQIVGSPGFEPPVPSYPLNLVDGGGALSAPCGDVINPCFVGTNAGQTGLLPLQHDLGALLIALSI